MQHDLVKVWLAIMVFASIMSFIVGLQIGSSEHLTSMNEAKERIQAEFCPDLYEGDEAFRACYQRVRELMGL